MNKQELITAIAEKANLSKVGAGKALNAFLSSISSALEKGDNVALTGFGSFSTKDRAARVGRNPQTGKNINIPAKRIVKFKVGKTLGDEVNNG